MSIWQGDEKFQDVIFSLPDFHALHLIRPTSYNYQGYRVMEWVHLGTLDGIQLRNVLYPICGQASWVIWIISWISKLPFLSTQRSIWEYQSSDGTRLKVLSCGWYCPVICLCSCHKMFSTERPRWVEESRMLTLSNGFVIKSQYLLKL